MGETVKIVDLARQLIRVSGYRKNDIAIECSGLRTGEMLYEKLVLDAETTVPTASPRFRFAMLRKQDNSHVVMA